jgi:hypothetical protein
LTIYNKIEKLYIDKNLSVNDACKKMDISLSKYYKICKVLNKKSVASGKIPNQQKGGNPIKITTKSDKNENEIENVTRVDLVNIMNEVEEQQSKLNLNKKCKLNI